MKQREIKFRVWHKQQQKMLSNDWLISSDAIYKYMVENDGIILMQYTGLKDKNGKEIYEGDIVSKRETNTMPYVGEVFFTDVRCAFAIRYDHNTKWMRYDDIGKCTWSETDGYCITNPESDRDDRLEVIGNIYEKPELLALDSSKL